MIKVVHIYNFLNRIIQNNHLLIYIKLMNIIHTLKNSIKQEKIILILTLTNCDRVRRHLWTSQTCLQVFLFCMNSILVSGKVFVIYADGRSLYMDSDIHADVDIRDFWTTLKHVSLRKHLILRAAINWMR